MAPSVPYTVQGYQLADCIGEGTAGRVYSAYASHSHQSETLAAVKVIPRAKVRSAVRREVGLHILLDHPNIVRLHCALPATPPSSTMPHYSLQPTALALVTDRARAGDLFTEVARAGCLAPSIVRRRLRDIASAVTYLHCNRIVHLDLKLENVVINNANVAQLIDFGCARSLDEVDTDGVGVLGGTLHYLAPEFIENPTRRPAESSDAWSLGVLAYTALCGYYPFNATAEGMSEEENDRATRRRIANSRPHRLPSGADIPSDLCRIIYGLLEKDPQKRMTIDDVVNELSHSMDVSSVAASRRLIQSESKYMDRHVLCNSRRPRSPSSPMQADFAPCSCGAQQTRAEALLVVDGVQRDTASAAIAVRRYMGETLARSKRNSPETFGDRCEKGSIVSAIHSVTSKQPCSGK